MKLRYKILVPFIIMLGCINAIIHFYWLPQYEKTVSAYLRQSEQKYLELLGLSLAPDLLAGDLGKVHSTLNNVMTSQEAWQRLLLVNGEGERIYPFQEVEFKDVNKLNVFERDINHLGHKIGSLKAVIDISGVLGRGMEEIRRLELLLIALLAIVSIIGVLIQFFWIKRPLNKLSEGLNQLSHGNYDVAFPKPSRDEIGKLTRSFENMKDKLKLREEQLQADRLRTSAIISNAGEAIFTIDYNGLIQDFNQAAEVIFGYKRDEIIGRNMRLLIPEPIRSQQDFFIRHYYMDSSGSDSSKGREAVAVDKSGKRIHVWLSIAEVRELKERLFVVALMDLSELKQAENELKRHRGPPGGTGHRADQGTGRGQGGGGDGQRGQKRVPGQHESRDKNPHQRHNRHDRTAGRHGPQRGAGGLSEDNQLRSQLPAGFGQRHSGSVETGGR